MQVLVLYYTKTGHTLEAANAVAEGIRAAGSSVDIVPIQDFQATLLNSYDALIVGSPCWAGAFGGPGIAQPIAKALGALAAESLAGKRCGAISVYAGKGGEATVKSLGAFAQGRGCRDFRPGPVAQAGVPLSLWVGPAVKPEDQARFRAYGAEFARP